MKGHWWREDLSALKLAITESTSGVIAGSFFRTFNFKCLDILFNGFVVISLTWRNWFSVSPWRF